MHRPQAEEIDHAKVVVAVGRGVVGNFSPQNRSRLSFRNATEVLAWRRV